MRIKRAQIVKHTHTIPQNDADTCAVSSTNQTPNRYQLTIDSNIQLLISNWTKRWAMRYSKGKYQMTNFQISFYDFCWWPKYNELNVAHSHIQSNYNITIVGTGQTDKHSGWQLSETFKCIFSINSFMWQFSVKLRVCINSFNRFENKTKRMDAQLVTKRIIVTIFVL